MNENHCADPFGELSRFLRESLRGLLRPEATTFADMLSDNAVMEFPYTSTGGVRRVEGRAAIAGYVSGVARLIRIDSIIPDAAHYATDSDTVVLEFRGLGSGIQTGKPYEQTYISVITLRDGFIFHYRDYWNPLVAFDTLNGDEAVTSLAKGGEG